MHSSERMAARLESLREHERTLRSEETSEARAARLEDVREHERTLRSIPASWLLSKVCVLKCVHALGVCAIKTWTTYRYISSVVLAPDWSVLPHWKSQSDPTSPP